MNTIYVDSYNCYYQCYYCFCYWIRGGKTSPALTTFTIIILKGCYEMIKAYCCIGYRSEDGGVDLENILKKLQIWLFPLEIRQQMKQKLQWVKVNISFKNVALFLIIERICFVEIFKTKKSLKSKRKITQPKIPPPKKTWLVFFVHIFSLLCV